jgi:phosphohistidine phosphatase
MLREAGAQGDHLMIVGHNPGLEDLALMLVPADLNNPARCALEEKLPTAAIVRVELDITDWHDLREGVGRLGAFTRPRDLDPSLGPGAD